MLVFGSHGCSMQIKPTILSQGAVTHCPFKINGWMDVWVDIDGQSTAPVRVTILFINPQGLFITQM